MREVECGQTDLAREFGPDFFPVQPPRDHQMQHKKEIRVEFQDDTLAKPAKASHRFAECLIERRFEGADEKRMGYPYTLKRVSNQSSLETLDVDENIGKFWQVEQSHAEPKEMRMLKKLCADSFWRDENW
jgi:hypothetical protein